MNLSITNYIGHDKRGKELQEDGNNFYGTNFIAKIKQTDFAANAFELEVFKTNPKFTRL